MVDVKQRDIQAVRLRVSIRPEFLEKRDSWGYTALHWSCVTTGDTRVLEFLLACGADLSAVCHTIPWRASSIAARHDNVEALKLLFRKGEQINATNVLDGNTALHCGYCFISNFCRCM